jgi:hypothetical protein
MSASVIIVFHALVITGGSIAIADTKAQALRPMVTVVNFILKVEMRGQVVGKVSEAWKGRTGALLLCTYMSNS